MEHVKTSLKLREEYYSLSTYTSLHCFGKLWEEILKFSKSNSQYQVIEYNQKCSELSKHSMDNKYKDPIVISCRKKDSMESQGAWKAEEGELVVGSD